MSYTHIMAHNAQGQYQQMGGGVVAARVEQLRKAGLKDGAHNLLLQEQIKNVKKVTDQIAHQTYLFRNQGRFTSEIAAQMAAAEEKAMNEFHAFCEMIMALPDHERRGYDGRPYKSQNQIWLEQQTALQEAHTQRLAAEQRVTDAITHAVDAVTAAGGQLVIVPHVSGGAGDWGVTVKHRILVVGIDAVTLPADVKQTILTHADGVAAEVLARQEAALKAPTPVVVEAVAVVETL
jgi:hypothetical protein